LRPGPRRAGAAGRYRWAILAAGTVAQASFSTIGFAVPVLAPALRDEYDLSLTEIGVVVAAELMGLTFALLPWGFAADRWGERRTLTVGLAASSAFLVGAAFAPGYPSLVALLILAGAAGGSVQSGSGRAVLSWFPASERGLALGVRQTAVPLGGAVAALVLPWLGSPRAGFLFVAGFVLASAVAGGLVLRPGTVENGVDPHDVEAGLRDRRLWLAAWGSGLYLVAQLALTSFVVLFLHDDRGFSARAAAGVLAVAQIVAAAFRIGAGRWSDVVRSRVRPLRAIGLAIAVGCGVVALAAGSPAWLLVPVLVAATALSMAWNGLSFTIAAELGGSRSGAAIGLQQTVLGVIGVGVPVAFAATVSATSWPAAFALAGLFPLVGWLALRPLAAH
jgi:sugar phosphate permease